MDEFLTVKELGLKLKFKEQSIYNLIYQKAFVLGKHYLKPRRKKILFIWTAVREWMHGGSAISNDEVETSLTDKVKYINDDDNKVEKSNDWKLKKKKNPNDSKKNQIKRYIV
ncbi:MAG: hypothetical protein V1872_07990 [bacterium]